jgi:hypothetical protein
MMSRLDTRLGLDRIIQTATKEEIGDWKDLVKISWKLLPILNAHKETIQHLFLCLFHKVYHWPTNYVQLYLYVPL